jgi:hypothetical protein
MPGSMQAGFTPGLQPRSIPAISFGMIYARFAKLSNKINVVAQTLALVV